MENAAEERERIWSSENIFHEKVGALDIYIFWALSCHYIRLFLRNELIPIL